ncbi:hypothetical protein D3C80_1048940 [compost metagenome]
MSVVTSDSNSDGVPDNMVMNGISSASQIATRTNTGTFPRKFDVTLDAKDVLAGRDELRVYINGRKFTRAKYVGSTIVVDETYVDENGVSQPVQASDALYIYFEMASPTVYADPAIVGREKVTGIQILFRNTVSAQPATHELEYLSFINRGPTLSIRIDNPQYAYFRRTTPELNDWAPVLYKDVAQARVDWGNSNVNANMKRFVGRTALNFAWFHRTPRYHLVDPSATNIIDMFVVTRAYYEEVRRWLRNEIAIAPTAPSALDLRTSYENVLDSRMISDTVVMHPGKFKYLFGAKAISQLRCEFKVIKSSGGRTTDNELKVAIVNIIRNFFDIDQWEFGETFYATELIATIHANLPGEVDSIVLVPTASQNYFGELFEVIPDEDELFLPSIDVSDIIIVEHYNSRVLKQA